MKQARKIATAALLCLTWHGWAQRVTDTVQIATVEVRAAAREALCAGSRVVQIDSAVAQAVPHATLGEVLAYATNILIKDYGGGGQQSAANLRGGGAARTQLTWEGVPLNSLSNGEHNLSLLPAGDFNQIEIDYSGGARGLGSGAFGGAIHVASTPQWDKRLGGTFRVDGGSFGTQGTYARVEGGGDRLHYSGSASLGQSRGDFPYYDYIRLRDERRMHADWVRMGTVHTLHFRAGARVAGKVAAWWQCQRANLPAIIGSNPLNAETQTDSSLRIAAQLTYMTSRTRLEYHGGYTYDRQLYTKKLTPTATDYSTWSEITNRTTLHRVGLYYYSKAITLDGGVQGAWRCADVTDYGGARQELSAAATARVQGDHPRLRWSLSARKEFDTQYQIPLILSAGAELRPARRLVLRAEAGNKFRAPTFNDLYWSAWGNPDLRPEHGASGECGARWHIAAKDSCSLWAEAGCYYAVVNDMILWTPQGAVWHPNNTAQARLRGVEALLAYRQTLTNGLGLGAHVAASLNAPYISKTYGGDTSSGNQSLGHRLYYVPLVGLNATAELRYRQWSASLGAAFESSRYYNLEKTLPPYATADIGIKRQWQLSEGRIVASAVVRNVGNTVYERVRSYPLPRRNFMFSVQYLI